MSPPTLFLSGIPAPRIARRISWYQQALLMVRSARRAMPGCRIVLGAGQGAAVPPLPCDAVLRVPCDPDLVMTSQCRLWLAFSRSKYFDGPAILVDPDLLFTRPLDAIFEKPFDVGLTWAWEKGLPHAINAGVVFLQRERPEAVDRFLARVLAYLEDLPRERQVW